MISSSSRRNKCIRTPQFTRMGQIACNQKAISPIRPSSQGSRYDEWVSDAQLFGSCRGTGVQINNVDVLLDQRLPNRLRAYLVGAALSYQPKLQFTAELSADLVGTSYFRPQPKYAVLAMSKNYSSPILLLGNERLSSTVDETTQKREGTMAEDRWCICTSCIRPQYASN